MTKVLVTGCAGFIGSHFTGLLLENGFEVIGVDNFDPFYPKEIKEKNISAFSNNAAFCFYEKDITEGLNDIPDTNIDIVVHLAAKAGVRPSIADPEAYIKTNITGTQKVHDFIISRGIKKFVFASSSSVYGNNAVIPFSEDDPVNKPISPYAFTKKAGEQMNFTLHHLNKVDVVNLRFFTVYGPGQRPDLAIHKFVKLIHNDEPLTLFGDGSTARDYTYVEDTVNGIFGAMQYCLSQNDVYEIFNLGNNRPIKLNTLAEEIYRLMGKEKKISYAPMQPGDVDITYADISKAERLLNYSPATDLESGLRKFINWYIAMQAK